MSTNAFPDLIDPLNAKITKLLTGAPEPMRAFDELSEPAAGSAA